VVGGRASFPASPATDDASGVVDDADIDVPDLRNDVWRYIDPALSVDFGVVGSASAHVDFLLCSLHSTHASLTTINVQLYTL
jgi:hypothetical protein